MIDLSKYPASWRSYYSHVDRGGAVCAGIACLAIIPIIPPAGRGHLSFLPIVAVIVASPSHCATGTSWGIPRPDRSLQSPSCRKGADLKKGTPTCAAGGNSQIVDPRVGRNGMADADHNCTARTTRGEWVGWTLVARSPKAGFFADRGEAR